MPSAVAAGEPAAAARGPSRRRRRVTAWDLEVLVGANVVVVVGLWWRQGGISEIHDAAAFDPARERRLRADAAAWEYFSRQAPWYRRTATDWVMSAKREETRDRRLARLIEDCAAGRPTGPLARP